MAGMHAVIPVGPDPVATPHYEAPERPVALSHREAAAARIRQFVEPADLLPDFSWAHRAVMLGRRTIHADRPLGGSTASIKARWAQEKSGRRSAGSTNWRIRAAAASQWERGTGRSGGSWCAAATRCGPTGIIACMPATRWTGSRTGS